MMKAAMQITERLMEQLLQRIDLKTQIVPTIFQVLVVLPELMLM